MAFTKDKGIIKYTGKIYNITFNVVDGSLTTNHPDGIKYIQKTTKNNDCDLSKLIKLVANASINIHPYVETIMAAAPKLWMVISTTDGCNMDTINELIKTAKQYWKYVLQLEKLEDKNPYRSENGYGCRGAISTIKVATLGLNELETKWYNRFHNVAFVKKFAGQLEMYHSFLTQRATNVVEWYSINKIDIAPYLTNKNLLQVLKELDSNREYLLTRKITDGLLATYEKYKALEGTDADGWSYQILNTYDQFKQEAQRMHNCLIRCDYAQKMADGRCVIVVATTPDGKRIDVELQPADGKMYVVQAYYNNDVRLKSVHEFHLLNWADGLHF